MTSSLTPTNARSIAGIAAQAAPPIKAAKMQAGIISASGSGAAYPTIPAPSAPISICPSPPMFQIPERNATATASPVNSSGVIICSVTERLGQPLNAPVSSAP